MEALILAALVFFFIITLKEPLNGLISLILITPFASTGILSLNIFGIPGMKLPNILAFLVLVIFLVSKKPYRIPKWHITFIVGVLTLFIVAVLRSTSYIPDTFNYVWGAEYSLGRYLLSYMVKPLLIFIPFILISLYIRTRENLNKIIVSVIGAIFILSCAILLFYVFSIPDNPAVRQVRFSIADAFGMNTNNLADFYIIAFPLVMAYTIYKKSLFPIIICFLSLASIGILYSRSAYLSVLAGILLYFIISGRWRWIPVYIGAFLLSLWLIPSSIKNRALMGLAGDDLNVISSGRIDSLWVPVLTEFLQDKTNILFGMGRYAIMGTDALKNGLTPKVSHAHSIYIDTLIDSGVIGLGFFVFMFLMMLKKFLVCQRSIADPFYREVLCGVSVSVVSFMLRGITDSFFFPALTNAFIWVVLGIGIAILHDHTLETCPSEDITLQSGGV